jgi:hypothetical protein
MIHEVTLPQGTLLVFRYEEGGPVVLSVEAVYIDMLLTSAQRSTRVTKLNEDDRLWWLPSFTALINAKYGTTFSDTQGWVIARTASLVGDQLKKTFDSIQKSLRNTESILSNSTQPNSKSSTSESPESVPNENSKSEFASNL